MKSAIVTPKELYNIIQPGQMFYLESDDEGIINNPCLHLVLFVDRNLYTLHIISLVSENCKIMSDLWTIDETIFLNENRVIRLMYD